MVAPSRLTLMLVAGFALVIPGAGFAAGCKGVRANRRHAGGAVAPRLRMGASGPENPAASRRSVFQMTFGVLAGLAMLPEMADADTCTRKDCQPQANFLPAGDTPQQKDMVQMPGLKGKNYGKTTYNYPDYTKTESGLQYKDVKVGTGPTPQQGDRVVFDWEGYTIGYYGRIFKAKNGVKGGAFADDTEFERFVVGAGVLVPGLEEGILGMSVGGVRQIVVPADIGYPLDDPSHEKVGPKPPNFDGQRALNFVLFNQGLIDKTLLFNVKIIRIDKPDTKGSFKKGGATVQATSEKAPRKKVAEPEEEEESEKLEEVE